MLLSKSPLDGTPRNRPLFSSLGSNESIIVTPPPPPTPTPTTTTTTTTFHETSAARSCLMPDSQNSCTLPAMVTSSCWNVTWLRCIHKRVMPRRAGYVICVSTRLCMRSLHQGGTALTEHGPPWIILARVCLHNWRGNSEVVQAPSILLSSDR